MIDNWFDLPYFESDEFKQLIHHISAEYNQKIILPKWSDVFNAFDYTPLNTLKVVILGQDPYPTIGHPHGLSFSVLPDVYPLPKSLQNIYKELYNDVGVRRTTGCLSDWAEQGVLLLNTSLTVQSGVPGSHSKIGWEKLTNMIIRTISDRKENIVFILWGKHAISKCKLIDDNKHHIIVSAHPSPLSVHKGFFGSKPFSRTNEYLKMHNIPGIIW